MADRVLAVETSVEAFFYTLVDEAASNQDLDTSQEARHYIVNLLAHYVRAAHLYERTAEGALTLRPLAGMYADALAAASEEARNQSLRRLGDVALFVSGVFPDSIRRRYLDVDYYIAMGEAAYSSLAEAVNDSLRWRALADIFDELAAKFPRFVELLSEVTEQSPLTNDTDLLRLYESWLQTGSARLHRKLIDAGLLPVSGSRGPKAN